MEVLDSDDPIFDKTLSETSEDKTMPEEKEETDRGFEDAANLMLTLCQQNEMEKQEKSREIQRHIETERRAIRYIVEEIYKGWRVSPSPETMGASVDGILGASCDFWDEDDGDGSPDHSHRILGDHSARAHARGSGMRVVKWVLYAEATYVINDPVRPFRKARNQSNAGRICFTQMHPDGARF